MAVFRRRVDGFQKKNQSLEEELPYPFIDLNGVLRVGCRTTNAVINNDKKHSVLAHERQQLAKLMIRSKYIRLLHAGHPDIQIDL